MLTIEEVTIMSGKMHKYNEKKVQQPSKDYKVGEPVPGTGVTTKKIQQKH